MRRPLLLFVSLFALLSLVASSCGDDGGGAAGDPDAGSGGDGAGGATDVGCTSNADCALLRDGLGACELAVCDTGAGTCSIVLAAEGAPCKDADPCTIQSSCIEGVCDPGTVIAACDDDNPCTDDSCATGTGCVNEPISGACSDGDPCTTNDACVEGECVGTLTGACSCTTTDDCAGFEDGNWCNGTLLCWQGQCQVDPATLVQCDAPADGCLVAACDPATGGCVDEPAPAGLACDDGDPCTADDACLAGVCGGTPACACDTDDDCVPVDDADLCNGVLACSDGFCVPDVDTFVTCEDDDATDCVSPICEPATGTCADAPVEDGSGCGSEPCIVGKVCDNGACVGGTAADCEDGNPCTLDLCVEGAGCEHQPATGQPCDDGDPCTADDACEADQCVGPTVLCVCGDGFCSAAEKQGCTCAEDCGDCLECGDGQCSPGEEATCPADCGEEPYCGDAVCDAPAEDAFTCPSDCGGGGGGACGDGVCDPFEVVFCPDDCCGDGVCDLLEDFLCPADCAPPDNCGDGICEFPSESADSCPEDCAVCGDGDCSLTESLESCPEDCTPPPVCGDGVCDEGEDAAHCAADCAPIAEDELADVAVDASPMDEVFDDIGPSLDAAEDVGPSLDVPADTAAVEVIESAVSLQSADGKAIAGLTWRASTTADGAPGVLLVHQYAGDKAQWAPYVEELALMGWIVLAIDLRGHGDSDPVDGALSDLLSDPEQAPLDVQAGIAWLAGDGTADAQRLAIVGTSIGANLACVASANGYGVALSVAISARDTAVASLAAKPLAELTFGPLFLLATEDDSSGDQAATAEAFFTLATEPKDKWVLPGAAHGKDLLIEHPSAWPLVVEFVAAHL